MRTPRHINRSATGGDDDGEEEIQGESDGRHGLAPRGTWCVTLQSTAPRARNKSETVNEKKHKKFVGRGNKKER